MILAVCVDNRLGLSFNNRRLSSDKSVIEDLLQSAGSEAIYVGQYSFSLFQNVKGNICVTDSFLKHNDGICFAEFGDFKAFVGDVQKLIVYKWNRNYPSDCKFPLELYTSNMSLRSIKEFPGYSHDCITREEYSR